MSATSSSRSCTGCCAATATRSSSTGASCSSSSSCTTSPARSSASAASARAPGSRCCSAATARTRCSCRSKEAEASVLEPFLGPSEFANHGERVVIGQRLMQATSDIFLGWLHVDAGLDGQARDFYVRQLKDWKGSAEIEQMVPEGHGRLRPLCGWTLARAHARSGDRIAIAAYLGGGTVRPRDRRVLRGVRRAERARLQGADRGRRLRQDQGGDRSLTPIDLASVTSRRRRLDRPKQRPCRVRA